MYRFRPFLIIASIFALLGLAQQAQAGSAIYQQNSAGVRLTTSLSVTFQANVSPNDTVLIIVSYANKGNTGNITASGLGATWSQVYTPPVINGMGVEYIYGQNVQPGFKTVTLSFPKFDNVAAMIIDWTGLTMVTDSGSQAQVSGTGTTPALTASTTNSDEVLVTAFTYTGGALVSSPQADFRTLPAPPIGFSPSLIAGYKTVSAPGTFTNTYTMNVSSSWMGVAVAFQSASPNLPLFSATPLTDFAPGELYLGKLSGMLYDGSNTMPAAHDTDGRSFAQQVQPLDASGNPSPTGKIAVVGMGMQNWNSELCTFNTSPASGCLPYSFFTQAAQFPGVNPQMVLVDCAQGSSFANTWVNPSNSSWQTCLSRLSTIYGVTPAQVQVVLWKNFNSYPKISLSSLSGSVCNSTVSFGTDPDACVYESLIGSVARTVKGQFPNVRQMFLHSRIYAGNSVGLEGPEPYSYEYGFSTKWVIQAQIDQVAGGAVSKLTGDLSYAKAPWLAWGPYLWAAGTTPRADGLFWMGGDFNADGAHVSTCPFYGVNCGVQKAANLLIGFYSTSPYTPWFLAPPSN